MQASTDDAGKVALMRVGGILGIAGAGFLGLLLVYYVHYFLTVESNGPIQIVVVFVAVGLSAAGAFFALAGQVRFAPWLFVAAWMLVSVIDSITYGFDPILVLLGLSWSEFALLIGPDLWLSIALWSVLFGKTLIAAAFILTLIAMARRPRQIDATLKPSIPGGLAVPDEHGNVPAGWYRDPDGKPAERYYNGEAWTEQSRPMTVGTAVATPGQFSYSSHTASGEPVSPKSRTVAAVLCWFLGIFGVHRFYVGKVGTGVAQIFTLGGLGIWALVDFIWILTGTWKDRDERVLANW